MKNEDQKILDSIAQAIYDKKGQNIVALDIREISSLTGYFLVAEGTVDRHVRSLGKTLVASMKKEGVDVFQVDGEMEGEWFVIDFGGIMVHIFTPEMRKKYALENLWKEGKIVDLNISVEREGL